MSHSAIKASILKYAQAYSELQHWQDSHYAIPGGDQKTGSIGEYYAYLYLLNTFPKAILNYGSHSEKGWDIKVIDDQRIVKKIQVKAISQYSKTRTISPIHKGWDVLYLIYLNRDLYPIGFWIIEDNSIFGSQDALKSKKCPIPGKERSGSKNIPFGNNLVKDLIKAVESH